jgi:hypothetical protein
MATQIEIPVFETEEFEFGGLNYVE